MPEPRLLAVDGLRVEYRSRGRTAVAVDDVSFWIGPGETLGLVGESGSGKTTIGRAIQGLLSPAAGSILFDGRDIARLRGRERRLLARDIQTVFQDPFGSLNPSRPVGATLAESLLVAERRASRKTVDQSIRSTLDLVGLPHAAAGRLPAELSGGQRQRVAIARALIGRPRLVICDESVSALDLSIQAHILNLLVDIQRERSVSYLFITHDLGVVRHVADRLIVLHRGQLTDTVKTPDLERAELSAYTRKLLAAAPVPDPLLQRQKRLDFERLLAVETR